MQNNLKFQQEWLANKLQKSSRDDGKEHRKPHHAGFEYAIQPDGRSILEHIRESSTRRFIFAFPPSTAAALSSLKTIEVQANAAASRYRKREEKPPEPELKEPVKQLAVYSSSGMESKLHDPIVSSSSISPSPRRRNRHNAIYGSHLPNAFNSPAVAAKVFGPRAALKEERELCREILFHNNSHSNNFVRNQQPLHEQTQSNDDDGDQYDSLFAEIDLDELVAQGTNQKQQPLAPASSVSKISSIDPIQYPNSSARFNYGVPTAQRNATTTTGVSSFSTRDNQNDDEGSMGTTSENYRYYPKQQDWSQNNNEFLQDRSHTNIKSRYSYSGAANLKLDDTVPLCPGHNQPCICLTANTSANQGRQFYKCAVMPDSEKCDFFQWKDNHPTSSSSFSYGTSSQLMSGEIKDIYAENRRKFGHHSFRPGQQEVIERAVRGEDVFVLMPTGGGKSLCYQLPAWCSPGLSVIFSPLLSLIQDQVQSLTKLGVESVFLNSQQDYDTETRHIMDRLYHTPAHGGIKLLYITPEKLSRSDAIKSLFRKLSDRGCISRFVIDEAHCLR